MGFPLDVEVCSEQLSELIFYGMRLLALFQHSKALDPREWRSDKTLNMVILRLPVDNLVLGLLDEELGDGEGGEDHLRLGNSGTERQL